ncbi:MAG TPA: carboxypeptidase-like regulatory domain-containing protein [Thermoanaerobaculia bacterium]|nr:carboxypeptidase-like regulatory domain-containing protein [Thermoanaerobaculia bacterium]
MILAPVFLAAVVSIQTAPFACNGELIAGDVRARLSDAGGATITVPDDAEIEIVLDSADCWAAPLVAREGGASTMRVWRRREIGGPLSLPRGSRSEVVLRGEISANGLPPTRVTCSASPNAWRCVLPQIPLDLKVSAEDFVPVYFWDLQPGERNRGLTLERGGSVSGWVGADGAPLDGVRVQLTPAAVAKANERDALRVQTRLASNRGFFQFTGVAAGEYTLTATKRGRATGETSLSVAANRESLIDALDLPPLSAVDLRVSPALDPSGQAWQVFLHKRELLDRSVRPVAQGVVSVDGAWKKDGLDRGPYLLSVRDASGAIFFERELSIDQPVLVLNADVAVIPIRGTVRAGDTPLEAELRFEAEAGLVTLRSNEQGEFSGSVPKDGHWNVTVTRIAQGQSTHLQNVAIRKRDDGTALVDLTLPSTYLEGKVVDERGQSVADGMVYVMRKGRLVAHASLDSGGTFDVLGVEPGELVLFARTTSGDSAEVKRELSEGTGALLTLIVSKGTTIKGRVRDAAGNGIAGAIVRSIAAAGRAIEIVSGPDGQFSFNLGSGSETADVILVAAGFPVKMTTISMQQPDVVLQPAYGRLHVAMGGAPPWPSVRRGARGFPLFSLFRPRHDSLDPYEIADDGFTIDVEPGAYAICLGGRCQDAIVRPGAIARIDTRAKKVKEQ